MPPSAFQAKKRGQGMWFAPASQAAVTRRNGNQRPISTVLPPWRCEERLAALEERLPPILEPARWRSRRAP